MPSCVFRRLTGLALCLLVGTTPVAAQQFDPAYRFRTSRTPHFAIHFHQGAEALAARLAVIAEETWEQFAARSGQNPPRLTHVVLSDQSESANGFATPSPRDLIVLYTAAPAPTDLMNPNDWLRTLFVHEFTHVFHLDRAEGWARVARALFGRAPWTFPNATLPLWQVEGLATWEESRTTAAAGRLHAGSFTSIAGEGLRLGTVPTIDRIGGGVTDWPSGLAPYAYGAPFHEWLADTYGPETLEALAETTAGSLPWFGPLRFRRVFGASASDLWKTYTTESGLRPDSPTDTSAQPDADRLTREGFVATGPRFLPRRCDGCPLEVVYSRRTPDDRPGLYLLNTDSLSNRRITTRFAGRTAAVADGQVYFDTGDLSRNAGPYNDLYVVTLATGDVTRLTRAARLLDPDVSPSARSVVAVQHSTPGQRDLVVVSLDSTGRAEATRTESLAAETGVQFDAPRWSPDGRTVAASRQPWIGLADIALIDVASGRLDLLTAGRNMQWATPTWRPDGQAVIAAGAHAGDPFDLYEIPLATRVPRRLTAHPGGATWPDVSGDGSTLVYVGYGTDGFDVYLGPYPAAGPAPDLIRSRAATAPVSASDPAAPVARPSSPYSPWSTVVPTFWSPIVTGTSPARIGAMIGGSDVLNYHAWTAAMAWPVDRRTVDVDVPADWSASYVYGRWRLQPWAAAARSTSVFSTDVGEPDPDLPSALIERTMEAGVRLVVRRLRDAHTVQVSVAQAVDTRLRVDDERQRDRSGLRAAWRYSSAQFHGYGISPERGVAAGAAVELVRPELGASGRSGTATVDGRAYLPGIAGHHVVALRAMRGATWGETAVRRLFVLGGGDPSVGPGTLDSKAGQLLRGFGPNTFAGRHVAALNADYRFPLARPQRGPGTWPLLLHSLHGAVIADVAHAWNQEFDWRHVKTSVGLEVAADIVLGYRLPLTVAAGVARGHDYGRLRSPRTTGYVRVGYAF